MSKELRWLHISDFHCREKLKWSQDVVLKSLLEDIKKNYSGELKPDLVFITGDISFSGQEEEFKIAQDFIDKLKEITEIDIDRIFFVPGNHDIDRNEEEDAIIGARTIIRNSGELDRIYTNPKRLKTLFNRQSVYRKFVNSNRENEIYTDRSLSHFINLNIKSINLKIVLIDTAWLAHDNTDIGNLVVGEHQIINPISDDCDDKLVFSLMHHPLYWLQEFEQLPIENLLVKNSHFVLRGHVHQSDTKHIEKENGNLIVFTAGAAYKSRTADNSYSFGKLDLLTGKGVKIAHSFYGSTKTWNINETNHWKLNNIPSMELDEVFSYVSSTANNFPYYISCLLKDLKTEIPKKINESVFGS